MKNKHFLKKKNEWIKSIWCVWKKNKSVSMKFICVSSNVLLYNYRTTEAEKTNIARPFAIKSGKGVAHVVSIISKVFDRKWWKFSHCLLKITAADAHNGHAQPVSTYILCTFLANRFSTLHAQNASVQNSMPASTHIQEYPALRFTFGTGIFLRDKNRWSESASTRINDI